MTDKKDMLHEAIKIPRLTIQGREDIIYSYP